MTALRSADRLVTLASLGVRCVEYAGHDAGDVWQSLARPISDLVVTVRGSNERPSYHQHNSVYGFVKLAPGAVVVDIVDPLGRYMPRSVEATVDVRLDDFREAFKRGVQPDTTGWDPIIAVPLFPAPGRVLAQGSTGVYGTVYDGAGSPLPYAHVEFETASGGHFRTHATASGDYYVRLAEARSGIDGITGARDPMISRNATIHRINTVPEPSQFLLEFPSDFEDLRPGIAAFAAVWSPVAAVPTASIPLQVGVLNRVDIG